MSSLSAEPDDNAIASIDGATSLVTTASRRAEVAAAPPSTMGTYAARPRLSAAAILIRNAVRRVMPRRRRVRQPPGRERPRRWTARVPPTTPHRRLAHRCQYGEPGIGQVPATADAVGDVAESLASTPRCSRHGGRQVGSGDGSGGGGVPWMFEHEPRHRAPYSSVGGVLTKRRRGGSRPARSTATIRPRSHASASGSSQRSERGPGQHLVGGAPANPAAPRNARTASAQGSRTRGGSESSSHGCTHKVMPGTPGAVARCDRTQDRRGLGLSRKPQPPPRGTCLARPCSRNERRVPRAIDPRRCGTDVRGPWDRRDCRRSAAAPCSSRR